MFGVISVTIDRILWHHSLGMGGRGIVGLEGWRKR